ncbi:hypothetical protein GOP80_08000 [Planococcaceae bacterium Storch 2/2-2]|nr:hypothetical protein [Planococcaceae bacterium Storch 2/2-2]
MDLMKFQNIRKELMQCENFFVSLYYSKMLKKRDEKVHHMSFERLGNRLFEKLSSHTQHFFHPMRLKDEKGYQLILRWLCWIGTFSHVGEGFYILLPKRTLIFNEQVKIRVGSPFQNPADQLQSVTWREWLLCPTVPQLAELYEKRIKNIPFLEELKLYEVTNGRGKVIHEVLENHWYYTYQEEYLGQNKLKNHYVVKKVDGCLRGAEFISGYRDLTFYMLDSQLENRFSLRHHSSGLLQLETTYRLPKAEHSLLLLLSVAEQRKRNKYVYYFEDVHVDVVQEIISHLLGKDEF